MEESEDASHRISAPKMVEELQRIRSWRSPGFWRVCFVSLCYGFITWTIGRDFLIVYLGVLVVAFMLYDLAMRRIENQIDLLLRTTCQQNDDPNET